MTRLVLAMERDGLVGRAADEHDGRVVWLRATAKGTRLLHEGRRRRVAALAGDLDRLSASDRATVAAAADILERMLAEGPDARRAAPRDRQRRAIGGAR